MTMYAPSDLQQISVGPGHGGCGETHLRDGDPWGVDCPQCEDYLRADGRWSPTVRGIPETYDQKLDREHYEKAGIQARDSLLAIAMARMSGIGNDQIPPVLQKMLTGTPAHVPGVTVCPSGHDNTPGNRYCGQCGTAMTVTAAKGELTGAAA